MIEIKLIREGREAQLVFLNASLLSELRQVLVDLLKEFKDVFKRTYA